MLTHGGLLVPYGVNNLSQDNGLPDSKVHWANMGPIWGRQDPGGLHVGPMNFAVCAVAWHH